MACSIACTQGGSQSPLGSEVLEGFVGNNFPGNVASFPKNSHHSTTRFCCAPKSLAHQKIIDPSLFRKNKKQGAVIFFEKNYQLKRQCHDISSMPSWYLKYAVPPARLKDDDQSMSLCFALCVAFGKAWHPMRWKNRGSSPTHLPQLQQAYWALKHAPLMGKFTRSDSGEG